MNIEHFIAKRIAFSDNKSFTKVIVRIAIAAIAISMTVMILTTAIISGFKKEISDKIFGFWGHIHITDSNVNRNFEIVPIPINKPFYDSIRQLKGVAYQEEPGYIDNLLKRDADVKYTQGGVKGVYPFIILPGLLNTKEDFQGVLLKGVDKNYNWEKMNRFIVDGKPIHYVQDSVSDELLISRNIASKLHLETGNKVVLNFIRDESQIKKRFTICGIYNTGLEEYDRRFGIVDLTKLQEILGWTTDEAQGMEVVLDNVNDLDVYSDYIYYEMVPQNYYVESIRAKFPGIFEWLKLQDINEKVIMQLMILVAIINMITVLLILILERTQMIGILKSLGMHNGSIRKIFLWNAGYIIGFGLLIGNLIGLGLAWLQQTFKFIRLDEANYYLDTAPIDIHPETVIVINIATMLITILFLTIPTLIITRITPVRALRFE